MLVSREIVVNLLLLHAIWGFSYLIGGAMLWPFGGGRKAIPNHADALSNLVVTTAVGLASISFLGFILGSIGLLYWLYLPITGIAIILFASLLRVNDEPRAFWQERWQVLKGAIQPYSIAIYAIALFCGFGAILPDTASDTQSYHLAYAYDWASSHRLIVDHFLRYPYYALNWQLLDAWMFALNLSTYTSLLTWLTCILTTLGIQSLLADQPFVVAGSTRGAKAGALATIALVLAPLSFQLSPVVLRWGTTSFIDVPQGLFFLVVVICAVRAYREPEDRRYLVALVFCGGFFVGMKATFVAFLPLLLGLLLAGARAARLSPSKLAALAALLIIFASPWYLRNFILADDPIPPILNIHFAGMDNKYDIADYNALEDQLRGNTRQQSIVTLPYDLFVHTNTDIFVDYGVTAAALLIFVPFLVVLAYRQFRKRFNWDISVLITAIASSFGILYWIDTSLFARYMLLFAATYSAFLAICLFRLPLGRRLQPFVILFALGLIAVPTPSSFHDISNFFQSWRIGIWQMTKYASRGAWQSDTLGAAREIEYLSNAENKVGRSRRVYSFGRLNLELREHGMIGLGDYFGPERFADLVIRIREGRLGDEIRLLDLDAILIDGTYLDPADYNGSSSFRLVVGKNLSPEFSPHTLSRLQAEALSLGFERVLLPNSKNVMLVRR